MNNDYNKAYILKVLGVILLAVVIAGGYLYLQNNNVFNQPIVEPKSQLGAAAGLVEATLGNTNVGTHTDESNRNSLNAFSFTATEAGTVTSMSVYIANAEAGSQYSLAIYADSAGSPGALIANTANQPVDATGWYTAPLAANLTAGTTYWLTYNTTNITKGKNVLSYTDGTGVYKWHLQTFGTWPASFGTVNGTASNVIPSLYLTYTKPAPADTITTTTSSTFSIGATITVSQGPISIRTTPSLTASVVGTANTGDQGVVLDGPTYSEGFNWWKVSYNNGSVVGWTTGAYQYVVTSTPPPPPPPTPFDFSLSIGSFNQTVEAGKATANNVVTVSKVAGTVESVALSASGLPAGATAVFTPTSCTPNTNNCTVNLVINTTTSVPAGSYSITVKGTSASATKTIVFTLSVTAPVVVTPPVSTTYQIGSRIRVAQGPLNVRSDVKIIPSTLLGSQPTNALGTIVGGPKTGSNNKYTWWQVNYDSGVDGWNTENYTTLDSAVPPPTVFDFSLTLAAASKSIIKGQTASNVVTLTNTGSATAQNVNLTVAGLPTGITGSFSPAGCLPTCSSTLLLTAATDAAVGNYPITVTAVGGGKTKTAQFTLNVSSPVILPVLDFTLTASSISALDQGNVANVNGSVNFTQSNSVQNVNLTVSGLPTGVSGVFNPASCNSLATGPSTCNFVLGLAALGSATPGSYNLTLTAAGGGKTLTAPLTLTVNSVVTTPKSTTFKTGDTVEVYGANLLNVRSGPGTGYTILGTKADGSTGVIQTDTNNGLYVDQNYWWKADFGGLVGWAAEAFLRLFQNIPPPPPPPPANTGGGVAVGAGLEFPWDTMRSKMFADVIYSARPFEATSLDASGWPQSDFTVKVMTESGDVPSGADRIDATGVFTLAFNGQADVGVVLGSAACPAGKTCSSSYNGGRVYYNSAINQSVAEITFAPSVDSSWTYALKFSNTKRTPTSALGSGVTEVRLIRPGHVSIAANGEYQAKQKFSQQFLNDIAPLSVIRLMDYLETNLVWADGDTDARIATLGADGRMDWSERPSLNRRSVDGIFGGPIEHMVDLANVSGKDLWINIPHLATDDYIRGLATYLKNNLNSTSNVYLEWSNEVWNCGQFKQCQDAGTWGSALGLKPRWYTAKRVIDAGLIFRSVFGDSAMMTKIRPVYADQFASPGETADALAWVYRTYPNLPNYYLYGLAIAPYYGANGYSDAGTPSQILAGMVDAINGRLNAIMSIVDRGGTYVDFYSIAKSYGLRYLAYEGGTDLGYSSINAANKIAAQYSAGMKDRTLGYLGQWSACGGDLFTYFNFSWGMSGKFQWGLTDNVGAPASRAPKLAGAAQAATTDKRYFECAPLNASTNFFSYNPAGVIGTGSGLTGTYYSDNNLTTVAKLKDNSSVVRIDPVINFIWNNYGSADAYPRTDYTGAVHTFSTRWTGQIEPKFTGTYRFEMELDAGDSATVKIGGQPVLGSTVNLTAGTKYPIEITYQPNGSGGIARLWWSSTGGSSGNQIRAIVPQSQLYAQ